MPGVRKTVSVPTGNSTGTVLVYMLSHDKITHIDKLEFI